MKKQNGITLMTLIITIVIMLILAFIAISSVSDSDILSQTEDASSKLNTLIQTEDNLRNQLIEELKPDDTQEDPIDPPTGGDTGVHTHEYTSEVTTAVTCTTDGVRTYTCKCGDTYTETITAPGHNYETTTTDATCTTAGTTTETCTRCGDTKTTTGKILGHSFVYVSNNDATCTSDGTKTGTCARCGEKETITDGDSALGHIYGESSYRAYNDWYHTKTTYCGRGADCDGYEYSSTDGKYYPEIIETVNEIRHNYNENYYCDLCNHTCSHDYQDRAYYDGYSICRACSKEFYDEEGDDDYISGGCEHNYELMEVAFDCEDGDEYMCKYCGDIYITDPVGHSFLTPGDPCEKCGAENPQQNGDGSTYCQHGILYTDCYYCNN